MLTSYIISTPTKYLIRCLPLVLAPLIFSTAAFSATPSSPIYVYIDKCQPGAEQNTFLETNATRLLEIALSNAGGPVYIEPVERTRVAAILNVDKTPNLILKSGGTQTVLLQVNTQFFFTCTYSKAASTNRWTILVQMEDVHTLATIGGTSGLYSDGETEAFDRLAIALRQKLMQFLHLAGPAVKYRVDICRATIEPKENNDRQVYASLIMKKISSRLSKQPNMRVNSQLTECESITPAQDELLLAGTIRATQEDNEHRIQEFDITIEIQKKSPEMTETVVAASGRCKNAELDSALEDLARQLQEGWEMKIGSQ